MERVARRDSAVGPGWTGVLVASAGVAVGALGARALGGAGDVILLVTVSALTIAVVVPLLARVAQWRRESELLRRQRERTQELLQAALEAHASIGVDEVEAAIVRRACALLGTDAARLDRVPPEVGELGARVRSALDPDRWLVVSRRPSGRPFDADDERLLELLVATTAAALDNARLHERTQGERRQLAEVIGSSSDGIFSLDPDGVVRSWNPAMARITGVPAEQAVGSPCGDVLDAWDGDGQPMPPCRWLDAGEDRSALSVEVVGARGERRWLECVLSPMPHGGVVVVARDASAEREIEAMKEDFLATVSHELRTPLTPIQGFLQTLMRDDASFGDEERRRFYDVMLRQSERLERLIRDLLDATSLQDHDHLFFPEETDWAGSVTRAVELFRRQEPNREFTLEIEAGLPHAVVDEQRGEQVLSNLLTNAVKYSPPRAPVRVRVARVGDEIVTTVTDNGPGIEPAERDRVFERFTRLGNHLTRRVGGAGLGLFIARRLVEGMGGRITVAEAPEGGASFSFTLPAVKRALARR